MVKTYKQAVATAIIGVLAFIGFLVVCVAALFGIAAYMFRDETKVIRSATYEDFAEHANAQAWIPLAMPESMRDFCESHDLDSNAIYACFCIDPKDIDQLAKGITEIKQDGLPEWPPVQRVFIREDYGCPSCSITQERLEVDVRTGFAKFTSNSSGVFRLFPYEGECAEP